MSLFFAYPVFHKGDHVKKKVLSKAGLSEKKIKKRGGGMAIQGGFLLRGVQTFCRVCM